VVAGGMAVLLAALSLATWLWWRPTSSPGQRGHGVNALWLRHQWVGQPHGEAEYAELAATLRAGQISDALFHVGPLDADGTIPPDRYRHAGALLSAAVEELAVLERPWRAADVLPGRHPALQTRAYLREVADRVDQVAIMTYGSYLPAEWLFGRYVAWQTREVVEAVGGRATVFMGVPTEGHPLRPAETVAAGLRGVRKGLDEAGVVPGREVGVAVFAEWTTSPAEWAAYRSGWLDAGAR
jgi:hypothetical protein